MANETMTDLRNELFATLRAVRDKDAPMDIDRARTVVDLAKAITDTAKVEVDHLRVVGGAASGFLALPAPEGGPAKGDAVEKIPGGRRITHRLPG